MTSVGPVIIVSRSRHIKVSAMVRVRGRHRFSVRVGVRDRNIDFQILRMKWNNNVIFLYRLANPKNVPKPSSNTKVIRSVILP